MGTAILILISGVVFSVTHFLCFALGVFSQDEALNALKNARKDRN